MPLFFVFSAIIGIVLADTTIIRLSVYTGGLANPGLDIMIFGLFVLAYCLTQHFLLKFIAVENKEIIYRKLDVVRRVIILIQYVQIAILIFLILQMIYTTAYSRLLLELAVWINYLSLIGLLGMLCQRFIEWFRINRSSIVIAYSVAMGMICVNAIFVILNVSTSLSGRGGATDAVGPLLNTVSTVVLANHVFNFSYLVTSILSFVFTWFATMLLLRQNARKVSRLKFWVIVLLPLVYFLSQIQSFFFTILEPFRISDPILFGIVYTLLFSATKPAGGIMFGLAFWIIARKVKQIHVKNYMVVSGYGLLLLFTCNQPLGISLAPYPPFGLITISYIGVASYMVLLGVYSSALSVASDEKLRRTIRKSVEDQPNLLEKIGSAQMQRQIENKISKITKDLSSELVQDTGVESSLEEESEMKLYVEKVLDEIASRKSQSSKV